MKKIFIYTIVVASSLAAGSLLGFGSKKLFKKEIDYSNADISAYVPDYQAIVDEIDGYTGNKGLFEKFSTSKVLNYSLEKFRTSENCATFTFGLSHSSVVDQLIRGCDIKNGNEYFEESLSKSKLVSVASRIYQTGAKSTAKFYQGSESDLVINDNEAYTSYSNSYKSFDSATYKATYGKTIDEMFIYLICEEGILSKTVTSNSDGYKVACKFDNEISTYFNKIQTEILKSDYIRESYQCILEILGKVNKEDLLDNIFSKFCLGK